MLAFILIAGRCYFKTSCWDSWDAKKGGEATGKTTGQGMNSNPYFFLGFLPLSFD